MLSGKTMKWLSWTGIVLPIVFAFYFIYQYGITVPYWDEWEFVTLLENYHNHQLSFGNFWEPHNEHRIFFPRILMFIFATISGWSIFLELCLNLVFCAVNLFFLFSLLDYTLNSKYNSIIKVIFSLLIFSMAQYENWAWGWTIQIYMAMTGTFAAIWSINKWQGNMKGLLIAILAGVFANYSFGTGLLIWPTVFLMLIFQKKWNLKHKIIWIVSGFITVALYYYKHSNSASSTSTSYFLSHPILYAKYVLGYLGSPLTLSLSSAIPVSLILILIMALSLWDIKKLDKEQFRKMVPWMALCFFSALSACITGISRIGFGVRQAMSSRYTAISTLFIISAIVLLYSSIILNLSKNKKASLKDKSFIVTVISVFAITFFISYRHGIVGMKARYNHVSSAFYCIDEPDKALDKDLGILYPNPDVVRQRIKILYELGYNFDK